MPKKTRAKPRVIVRSHPAPKCICCETDLTGEVLRVNEKGTGLVIELCSNCLTSENAYRLPEFFDKARARLN